MSRSLIAGLEGVITGIVPVLLEDGALPPAEVASLLHWAASKPLSPAGMSRGAGRWTSSAWRGDLSAWVTDEFRAALKSPPVEPGLDALSALRPAALLLDRVARGLAAASAAAADDVSVDPSDVSVQLGCYPGGGSRYATHVDAFPASPGERVRLYTVLLYPNVGWGEGEASVPGEGDPGGSLRVFFPPPQSGGGSAPPTGALASPALLEALQATVDAEAGSDEAAPSPRPTGGWGAFQDVAPLGGRIVVFRSDAVPHAVLPTRARRFALTMWVHGRRCHGGDSSGGRVVLSTLAAASPPASPGLSLSSLAGGHQLLPASALSRIAALLGGATSSAPPPTAASAARASPRLAPPSASSIFVVVPSYRDADCGATLESLFSAAARPEDVSVGLCLQRRSEGDPGAELGPGGADSLPGALSPASTWHARVRAVVLPAADAAGPIWARHLAASLFRGEAFVLWVDSHMRFARGWDDVLRAQLEAAEEAAAAARAPESSQPPKVLLTTYPPDWDSPAHGYSPGCGPAALTVVMEPRGGGGLGSVALGAAGSGQVSPHGPDGFLRFVGRELPHPAPSSPALPPPVPSRGVAAGFLFARAPPFLTELPPDPSLRHAFFGEEPALLARAWTRGWEAWAPGATVVWHRWARAGRPSFRESGGGAWAQEEAARSDARLRAVLSGRLLQQQSEGEGGGGFGLGAARSLASLEGLLRVPLLAAPLAAAAAAAPTSACAGDATAGDPASAS